MTTPEEWSRAMSLDQDDAAVIYAIQKESWNAALDRMTHEIDRSNFPVEIKELLGQMATMLRML